MTPFKINLFSFFKLPSAWLMGVRSSEINDEFSIVKVRHRWINQNPFNSMFWAVQGMAAELTGGSLLMKYIKKSGKIISMLVLKNKAEFFKKAKGEITFKCSQGKEAELIIKNVIETSKPKQILMVSYGIDEVGDKVSRFEFEWTVLLKK